MSKNIVSAIWHYKVEDNLSWKLCAAILKQNRGWEISSAELKKEFMAYFKQEVGIAPYTQCPDCGEKLVPRKSQWGYFVGCSAFPQCGFLESDTKPFEKIKGEKKNGKSN